MCSLPYRQLRNETYRVVFDLDSSLPYRQLRKSALAYLRLSGCSLPYRQLRNAQDIISSANLHFGYEVLEVRSETKTTYVSNYDLKAFPEECELGMFDAAILSLPMEFTLTQSFTSLTTTAAVSEIDQQLNKLESVEDGAEHQHADIKNAKKLYFPIV